MLAQLRIENFALVEKLVIDFCPQLNVLTGETGAGKSILINAVRFVLGERMDTQKVSPGEKKTVIEAVFEVEMKVFGNDSLWNQFFEDDDDVFILRRECLATGKTRAWINGRSVNTSLLREVGARLIDIHGQHDHQLLLDSKTHLEMLDGYAKLEKVKEAYTEIFLNYKTHLKKRRDLRSLQAGRERELDLLKYQIDEIEAAGLQEDEDNDLKLERIRLANAEKLFELASVAMNSLDGDNFSVSSKLGDAYRALSGLSKLDESLEPLRGSFEDAQLALEEVLRSVRDYQEGLSFDEDRLLEIEKRLDLIELLKRKYGTTVAEILEFYEKAKIQYDQLINSSLYEQETERELAALEPELKVLADELHKKRVQAAQRIKTSIERELHDLGLKHAQFEVDFQKEPDTYGAAGYDRAKFMISLNPGHAVMDLVKIISGGEAARVMLALKKGLVEVDPVPSLIFDEIDSNIGGRLGTVVGTKLKEIASGHQVLLITHLPQIASFADRHFKVTKRASKSKTVTEYQTLEGQERVRELAQMMSGNNETEISKKHAEEMLGRVKACL